MSADPTQNLSVSGSLSTAEVAQLTGLTQSYVRRLARDGGIPGSSRETVGRSGWVFDRTLVQEWLASRKPGLGESGGSASQQPWVNELLLSENADLRRRELQRSLEIAESENAKLRRHIEILNRTVSELMAAAVDVEVDHRT